jgi:hypothetical protein
VAKACKRRRRRAALAHSLIRTASFGPEGELGILGMYRPPQPLSGHAGASPLSTASCSGK